MARTFMMLSILCLGLSVSASAGPRVQTGLDRLFAETGDWLDGKRVGVITDHTGVDSKGRHLVDLIIDSDRVTLAAIFSPEHGFGGDVPDGLPVADARYRAVPIHSLYGTNFRPSPETVSRLDAIIYDLQDVGARFYTYISTLGLGLEVAAGAGIPFLVLDRPNPIGGLRVEGPVLDPRFRSFVGRYPIPIRYGLTAGELSRMMVGEGWLPIDSEPDLRIIKMSGWERAMTFEDTGITWRKPSPNMTTPLTAVVYPGMCLLEGTNLSEGRGTDEPFLVVGAPWLDSETAALKLNQAGLPGVTFETVSFTPRAIPGVVDRPKYMDQPCRGLRLRVDDRQRFLPVLTGVTLIGLVRQLHEEDFRWRASFFDRLAGTETLRLALEAGVNPKVIVDSWSQNLLTYDRMRNNYLLY